MVDIRNITGSSENDDEIDLLSLLGTIWAGKFQIFGFVFAFFVLALFYLLITPPSYQADALLQLEEKKGQLSLPAGLTDLVEDAPESVTEIEIIKSRMVLGQVVADLNLDWSASSKLAPFVGYGLTRLQLPISDWGFMRRYAKGGEQIRLDLFQVPPEWINETLVVTKGDGPAFTVTLPNEAKLQGTVGEMLREADAGFALKIGVLEGDPGREFNLVHTLESSAIEGLRGGLSVSEKGRQSGILQLSFTSTNRELAQRILHGITHAYLNQNVSRSAAEAQSSLEFVEKQLPEAEALVREAERDLNQYRESQTAIDLSFETQSLLTQIGQLEVELSQLQIEEDKLKENYTPNHPVYKQLLNTKAHLEARIEALRAETNELPETQREVFDKTRRLELAEKTYLQLLSRAQELRVLKASSIGNVRIVDEAQAGIRAVAPRKSRTAALSIVLGFLVGVGFVLARAAMRKGVQSSEQIEELGISVFATINASSSEEPESRGSGSRKILAVSHPTDLAVEAFRSLRTSLHFGMLDAKSKSIVITSAAPSAGKSFTAVNLAVVAAQTGMRVCLVDADLRRGQLRKSFNMRKGTTGLADLLADDATLDQAMHKTMVDGLSFIPTGKYPPNPSELLMRKGMADLIADLDSKFDLVIVDTPPALAVTDPIILGQKAGAILAVIRHDVTPPGEVEALRKNIETAGLKITGAILNGFDASKAKSGQYYYYNYRYSYENRKE